MTRKRLTLLELLDLIDLEDYRGIIRKKDFLAHVKKGVLPTVIKDIRGAIRLTVKRDKEAFLVTQHPTKTANKTLCEVY